MILHAYPHSVVATITESLSPVDRSAIYEQPIDAALTNARIGTVTGGGSQVSAGSVIAFVDVEIALANVDDALEQLRELLQQLGAPAGSTLTYARDGIAMTIAVATGEPVERTTGNHAALARRLLDVEGEIGETEDDAVAAEAGDQVPQYDPTVVQASAAKILSSYRSLMVDAYAYGPITRSAYDASVFRWYDERSAELNAIGFEMLDDLKIVQTAGAIEPGAGPFARRFVSLDQQHRADIFQMKAPDGVTSVRVMNLITELSDERFIWSCTAEQRWDTPPHIDLQYLPASIAVEAFLASHATRVQAYLHEHAGVEVVPVATLQESLESEQRCQARSAAFRRAQQVPTVQELVRLGSAPHLARLVHDELQRLLVPAPAPAAVASDAAAATGSGEWTVTTIDMPTPGRVPLSFDALIAFALDQGITQVERAGSPLNPFLVYDTGRAHFFVCMDGDSDPLEIALQTLADDTVQPDACALVIDSRLTLRDGKKDAIVVMASQRGAGQGVTWAQTYRPKGFLRGFKPLAFREQIATSRNFFDEVAVTR